MGFFGSFLGSKIPPKHGVYRIWADICDNVSGFWVWAYTQETVPKVTELKIRSNHVAQCYTLKGGVLKNGKIIKFVRNTSEKFIRLEQSMKFVSKMQ